MTTNTDTAPEWMADPDDHGIIHQDQGDAEDIDDGPYGLDCGLAAAGGEPDYPQDCDKVNAVIIMRGGRFDGMRLAAEVEHAAEFSDVLRGMAEAFDAVGAGFEGN